MNINKIRNKIYVALTCILFIFLFLWCPVMSILEKSGALTFEDNRNYIDPVKIYEGVPLGNLLNKIEEGKASLENIYTNYLPSYTQIVQAMKNTETKIQINFVDMLSSYFNKNPENPAKSDVIDSAGNNGGIDGDGQEEETTKPPAPQFSAVYVGEETHRRFYAVRPYDFLESVLKLDEDSLYENMKGRAAEINRLIKANTDVDFYLYIGKTMQDEEYFNDIIPNELCTADMFNEFMDSIEGAAGKDYFKIGTLEDKLAKQWRTDHHWNAAGCYDVYCDIIRMVAKNTPEIGEPVKVKEIKEYPNIKMRGSYAALSGFSNFYEDFFVYVYDFKNEGHRSFAMRSRESQYDSGRFDNEKNIYFDHYSNYYTQKSKYVYDNNTGRNLLIIGDSLTYWSAWLIASNFDTTYIYMPWDGQTIDYNEYIKENKITDVLLMVYSQAGIFNVYGYCTYEQLRTD